MNFNAAKGEVLNRGRAPLSFLAFIVEWARQAADEIFAPNDNPADLYALISPLLGNPKPNPIPADWVRWHSLFHRRAAMLEVMRVHAGFESSWNWREGVDKSNQTSMANITGQETGIFQVSFDSLRLGGGAMMQFAKEHSIDTPRKFIDAMKGDHQLALEYYARLVRIDIRWAGPLLRHEINPFLSRDSVAEFETALTAV